MIQWLFRKISHSGRWSHQWGDSPNLSETGWWFGTWMLWLSIYWECHHPNWLSLHDFSVRGRYKVETTNQMPWDFTTIKSHETRRVSSQVSLALGTPSPLPVRCPMRGTAGRASWSWARPVWSGDAAMACHGDARKMGTSPPKMEFDPAKCWILYHKWWEITIKNDG